MGGTHVFQSLFGKKVISKFLECRHGWCVSWIDVVSTMLKIIKVGRGSITYFWYGRLLIVMVAVAAF